MYFLLAEEKKVNQDPSGRRQALSAIRENREIPSFPSLLELTLGPFP